MKKNLRNSGIDIIGDVPWGTHFCQFYRTREDLIDILVPYFKAGLENNEFCIWVTSQPLEVEEAKEALRKAISDFDFYLEKGQIEIIPYTHWYIKEGIFDSERVLNGWVEKLNQALAGGYDGLRLRGDTFWREEKDWDNFVEYEEKVDGVIGNYQMMALCTYSLDRCNATEIIDVINNHQFALIKKGGKWEQRESTRQKRMEEALHQSEQRVRTKLESILSPAGKKANLKLADIVDSRAIQSLLDDFYKFAPITMALLDLKGNVLVNVGWQEICTRFHRVHPETCKHCVESDTKLSAGVASGEFKLYKCKNNMWSVATPIVVEGQHVGNILSGQFFFEGETPDYELFRIQARKYGFNEEEYIAALEKVPRLSRETIGICMAFFMKLAHMISQLGYSNIKMARSLAERDTLLDAVRESEEKYRNLMETVNEGIWILDAEARTTYVNEKMAEMLRCSREAIVGKSVRDFTDEEGRAIFEMNMKKRRGGISESHEFKLLRKDGLPLWALVNSKALFDKDGKFTGSISMHTDITERKKAEEALILSNLYNRSLIEVSLDPSVTIGRDGKIKDVNVATEQVTGYSRNNLIGTDFSDYFTESEKARIGYQQVFIDGKVRDYPLEIQHKDGQITPVLYNASVYKDENGEIIGVFAAARDITEHKKAEEALKKAHENLEEKVKERTTQLEKAYNSLKESEKGLAEAQKMAHIGNWDWDLVTGEVYWSDEMYRIYGRNPQEPGAAYRELLNYVHPEDRGYVDKSIKKGLKEETSIKKGLKEETKSGIDYRIILANGEERIVYAQAEVIFDERNDPVRVKGITQDITERKKSEEKIQILANIVESSNDAIGTISLDGIITSWNEEAEQVYGYSAEEILGKHTSILAPPHLEKETKELSELIKQGKKIHHHETSRLRKDGKRIDVSITLSPVFDSHGKLTEISFISRDITERKRVEEKLRESEEKYRNIVETATEGIFVIDAETIVTYANKKMADMLGYTLEEIIGIAVWDFISEDCKHIVNLNLERRRQGVNEIYELKLICKGGSSLWVLISAKSLFDKYGKFMGSINMLTDITKRKEAEEALANIEIARKKEIHHRIKNNLQVISSLLDLQAEKFNNREDIKDSEVLEAFRESQDRVISMALIHEELYKGGGFDTLNFSSYIEELAENLFQTYSLGNADVSLKMDLEEKIFFDMDIAVPLGMIVNELVSNSLKHAFTEEEEGEIRIQLCREEINNELEKSQKNSELDKSLFSLTISDNGKGIPENVELECFESLGLQLVSILVDQLDGKIELKQEQGTKFRITFKVAERS